MTRHSIIILCLALVISAFGDGSTARSEDEGWVPLFDGKTLDGWKVNGGYAKYEVEGGPIVGTTIEGSSNTFLCKGD